MWLVAGRQGSGPGARGREGGGTRHLDVLRGHSDHLGTRGQTGPRLDRPDRPQGHASQLASSPASCSAFSTWPPAELTMGSFTRKQTGDPSGGHDGQFNLSERISPKSRTRRSRSGSPCAADCAVAQPASACRERLAVAGLGAAILDPAVASARQVADSRQAGTGRSFSPETGRILQEIIASGLGASNAPGLNVGVWVPGRGSYVQALGVSDLATDAPLQPMIISASAASPKPSPRRRFSNSWTKAKSASMTGWHATLPASRTVTRSPLPSCWA